MEVTRKNGTKSLGYWDVQHWAISEVVYHSQAQSRLKERGLFREIPFVFLSPTPKSRVKTRGSQKVSGQAPRAID
jgi:hypothetical protein